jgi:5-hydroxyisourate hydrolase-like protein (transthyretin family)
MDKMVPGVHQGDMRLRRFHMHKHVLLLTTVLILASGANATAQGPMVSLQEFQAAHERIFKAMDTNKDGRLTLEEMQTFMQGTRRSVPPQ